MTNSKIFNLTSSECAKCSKPFSKKHVAKKISPQLQRDCFFNGYIITDNCSWHSDCKNEHKTTQQFINHYKDEFEIYKAKNIQLMLIY